MPMRQELLGLVSFLFPNRVEHFLEARRSKVLFFDIYTFMTLLMTETFGSRISVRLARTLLRLSLCEVMRLGSEAAQVQNWALRDS
jgi:hypothetical protein